MHARPSKSDTTLETQHSRLFDLASGRHRGVTACKLAFLGGTTVAGWRNGGDWEFWYQNWGSVNGSGVKLLKAKSLTQKLRRAPIA